MNQPTNRPQTNEPTNKQTKKVIHIMSIKHETLSSGFPTTSGHSAQAKTGPWRWWRSCNENWCIIRWHSPYILVYKDPLHPPTFWYLQAIYFDLKVCSWWIVKYIRELLFLMVVYISFQYSSWVPLFLIHSPKLTSEALENGWLEYHFPFGARPIFWLLVSGRVACEHNVSFAKQMSSKY